MKKKLVSAVVATMMLLPSVPITVNGASEMNVIKVDCSSVGSTIDENGNYYNLDNGVRVYSDIASAKDYVRIADKTSGDITVKISDGFYYLPETITFTPEDSGTQDCVIRYEAEDINNKPIISGGYELDAEWTKVEETTGGVIYKTELNRDEKLRAIYVDGERAVMTKRDIDGTRSTEMYTITPDSSNSDWAWTSGTAAAGTIFPEGTIPADTKNPRNIELETQTTWNKALVCVDKIEVQADNSIMARLQQPYGAMAQLIGWAMYMPEATSKNTVYNVFEWLENPNEFYFDEAGKTLYYVCGKDENVNDMQVIIPQTETLFDIQGVHTVGDSEEYKFVEYLEFNGLCFAYTDWNLWEVDGSYGNASVQAATSFVKMGKPSWHEDIYRSYDVPPAAFKADIIKNVNITNGSVLNTGSLGIHLENDINDCTIKGNSVKYTGGSGIVIGHPQHVYENDPDTYKVSKGVAGADKEKFVRGTESVPKNIFIDNNYLRDTCVFFPGHAPITTFYTQNMQILHNFIYGAPYSGISFGWGWNNFDGNASATLPNIATETSFNNKLNENRIENIMTMLSDAGAIYSLGKQGKSDWTDYTEMNRNYMNFSRVPNVKRSSSKRGVHTDEGSAYIKVEENVITNFGCVYEFNDWKRKHDISADSNYTNETFWRSGAPQCTVTNEYYDADSIWDNKGYEVVLYSGLEDEYKHLIDADLTNDLMEVLPASVCLAPSSEIKLGGTLTSNDTVWIAEENTSVFAESDAMTKASGDAGKITVPEKNGTYRVYIVYEDGTVSEPSDNVVLVGSKAANINDGEVKYVSKVNPFELILKEEYTYTLNGNEVKEVCKIDTAGEWELAATEKTSGGVLTIRFKTLVSDPDMLLWYDLNVKPGNTIHLSDNLNDETKSIWIAPYATVDGFVESDKMTKAVGNVDTIKIPESTEVELYNLYVIDAEGTVSVSAASLSTKDASTLAHPQEVAASIISLESVNIDDKAIIMPTMPAGYVINVKSSDPAIIDKYGNITAEYDGRNISIVFEVFRCDDNTSALTSPIITGLPPEPAAPEYIEGTWVKTAAEVTNMTNTAGGTKPKIENATSDTPNVGYIYNNAYQLTDKTDSVGEVYFCYPGCSLKGLKSLSLNVNGRGSKGEVYAYICLGSADISKAIASTQLKKSSYAQYEMDVTLPDNIDTESVYDLYVVFASYNDTETKYLANVRELSGSYSYKNEEYRILCVSGFNVTENTTSAAITINDDCVGKVIAAIYDENERCIGVQHFDAKATMRISFAKQAKYLKVFYWDNLETMMPKCDAVVVNQ